MTRFPRTALLGGFLVACSLDPLKTRSPQVIDSGEPGADTRDDPPAPPGPMPAAARRLTDPRYRRSASALTGVDFTGDLPLDYDLHGYVTVGAAGITTSPYDLEVYEAAAWSIARAAVPDATSRDAFMGCPVLASPLEDDPGLDLGCVDTFLADLLERGYRRPPTTDELAAIRSLYVDVADLSTATLATQAAVAATLLSPHFLYIVEVGTSDADRPDERVLTEWELASRLSYFLTDGPPDAPLRADIGRLREPGVLADHATRLLATDQGHDALTRFFVETLELGRLDTADKDATLYPEDSPTLRAAMRAELEALWADIALEEDADIRLLLTSESALVTPELAALYGVPDVSAPTRVTLPADQERGGLLGRAGFAALNATAVRTSPTFRGKFVRMRLLCEDVPPPPEDVVASLDGSTVEGTLRDQLEVHMTDPACLPCHQMMDPLGFGMEHLDALGRWRSTDNGYEIDATGDLDGVPFANARGLGAAVAADPRFGACMARQLHRHATGGLEGERQEDAVEALATALSDGGHRLSSLVVALVEHDDFQRVAAPTTEAECEVIGATRPCESTCGDGIETCLGGIWQGCTGTSAPHESCDGVDADCDGVVDHVVEACADGLATCTDGSFGACEGPDREPVETCDGIDNDGDGIIDSDHGVEGLMAIDVITVSLDDVTAAHEGCDPLADDTTTGPCGAAANRICASAGCGLRTGYGPVAVDAVDQRASFICLDDTRSVQVWTTFSELASHHAWCSVADPVSPDCNASINRLCNSRGYTTGFGSLEHGSEELVVACTPSASVFRVPYSELTAIDAGCAWPSDKFNTACRGAMHDWCAASGFATGHGPLENWEGDAWVACIPPVSGDTP
mgnify:CR=1 FL=1